MAPVTSSDIPQVRGSTLLGFIEAARRLEGDSLDQVRSALATDLAHGLFDELVLASAWFPESTLVDLCQAVFRGPLREAPGPYAAYLGRSVDLGWGRVQRALVAFATPKMLAERAAKLWRREHSHGELIAEVTGPRASLLLRDHPYADTTFSRGLIAELLRYIVSLTRVGVVRQVHTLEGAGTVRIVLQW